MALLGHLWHLDNDPMSGWVASTGSLRDMLLPENRRVVLEVDGMRHCTRNAGTEPDGTKYAATTAGDRALKFRGYEVFRFGHDELRDHDRAQPLPAGFFATLLDRSPASPSQVPLSAQG
ncbi:hypothetical protein [Streptomyces sp. NPDC056492]|uniref:hypothetical protein n=1 Tax=unclassified Streptomyces TaxID=2593676 RepID=UPI00368059B7